MIETFGTAALWLVAGGLLAIGLFVLFGVLLEKDYTGFTNGTDLRWGSGMTFAGLLIAALLLSGCETAREPAAEIRAVEVVRPVAVRPIEPKDVPAVPAPLPPRPSSLSAAADLLASKWCEAVAYFLKADPLLKTSAGAPQQDLPRYPECERR
jgi:hypothetical protein